MMLMSLRADFFFNRHTEPKYLNNDCPCRNQGRAIRVFKIEIRQNIALPSKKPQVFMKPYPRGTELCNVTKTLRSTLKEIYIAKRIMPFSCLDPELPNSTDQVSFISKKKLQVHGRCPIHCWGNPGTKCKNNKTSKIPTSSLCVSQAKQVRVHMGNSKI